MQMQRYLLLGVMTLALTVPSLQSVAHDGVDLTQLPLGDHRLSSSPKVGWIWPCRTDPNAGGAFRDGPWINSINGTYNLSAKAIVDGNETWPNQFRMRVEGTQRIFETNTLPSHTTGIFPISTRDDAYSYDRNPNRIHQQSIAVVLPTEPTLANAPSCVPGAIGILLSGAVLFNALDAPGRDAVAHETQDTCQGHPQNSGVYHYHNISTCVEESATTQNAQEHSPLVGYLLDGFGIYGRHGENGQLLTSSDLDECHGHTHSIHWDGQQKNMYHYHATWDFPYTAGCMRGQYSMENMMKISGGPQPTNGGSMMPANAQNGPPLGQGRPDLTRAAQILGISEAQLRSALGPPPPNLRNTAQTLGISEEQLRQALHPQ